MRKIKEILRLHFEQKLGQRQIARSAGISQSTVHEYLARMKDAGLEWPLGEEWDEERLEKALHPQNQTPANLPQRPQPDFNRIRQQLEQHRDLTIELLWEEFRQQHPDGYSYSRFCKLPFPRPPSPPAAGQPPLRSGSRRRKRGRFSCHSDHWRSE